MLNVDAAKPKVQKVREFAEKAENHYVVGVSQVIPGNDPRYVADLDTYHCVFSITKTPEGGIYRHLSISVPSTKLPNIFITFTIAEMFGFTGWNGTALRPLPKGWAASVHEKDNCIVLAQLIPQ
jgi:hypothetical protein